MCCAPYTTKTNLSSEWHSFLTFPNIREKEILQEIDRNMTLIMNACNEHKAFYVFGLLADLSVQKHLVK